MEMIEVSELRKSYAGHQAVRGISFSVAKGEIVGLLGPNGAGKSTTMRILTGYLPATAGSVRVAGLDLLTESLAVRRKVGYMPELVPLYPDMRVGDFLTYRAALKGVARRQARVKVGAAMERCGVTDVARKMIGALSRGYRQRVGLADALVHEPELLILDEPTAGLDPNQIRSVRELIKELGKGHTILLSTHILPEVEMVCQRAIIINRGKIEASDTLGNLAKRVKGGALLVEVKAADGEALARRVGALPGVSAVTVSGVTDGWVVLECAARPGEDIRGTVDEFIKRENLPLREFRCGKASLEDVFVELVQE
ncbi:MAG: ABC transporter ATP-binding protein [Verrucomicrobiales bacterium]|jgi:ABC-2 type transport system ATP-binding protein|nr:ABC transporter ATP-binding protein [Verrucomicrobiales bacterium]